MESLTARWNREKVEAIEQARVFDVEERDGCLVLTKRLSPFLPQAQGSVLAALGWMFVNWQIFQSPVNRGIWIGWIALWMLIGPMLAFFPIRQAWKIRQGDVWVFNRQSGQLEHNGFPIATLKHIKSVFVHTSNESAVDSNLWIKCQIVKDVVLNDQGMREEHQRVGQQIADFLEVRFNPPYW